MKDNSPPSIRFKISYNTPLPLEKFSACLASFSDEYNHFVKKKGFIPPPSDAPIDLCIKEINKGSIEIVLTTPAGITLSAASLMPLFIEHFQVILEFGKYLKSILDYLVDNEAIPEKINRRTCQNIKDMTEVIATNPNSQININFCGDLINSNVKILIGNQEAQEIQKNVEKEIEQLKEQGDEEIKEMLFVWQQLKRGEGSARGRTGDKGIIESISEKPLSIYFPENSAWVKAKMITQEKNPLNKAYIVDAIIKKLNGRPIAYYITNFHKELDLE